MTTGRARRDHRHRSREAALQVLYQAEVGRAGIDAALETFWSLKPAPARQRAFATRLAKGTAEHLPDIDSLIVGSAEHWRLSRMAVLDRLIMRLAVYEFLYGDDTPRAVVIDEALELARTFSADEAVAFINGVLDDIKQKLDAGELSSVGSAGGDDTGRRR